jgi:hypothetical protein
MNDQAKKRLEKLRLEYFYAVVSGDQKKIKKLAAAIRLLKEGAK